MPMSWGTDGEEEQDHCRILEEFLRWAERREIMLNAKVGIKPRLS